MRLTLELRDSAASGNGSDTVCGMGGLVAVSLLRDHQASRDLQLDFALGRKFARVWGREHLRPLRSVMRESLSLCEIAERARRCLAKIDARIAADRVRKSAKRGALNSFPYLVS